MSVVALPMSLVVMMGQGCPSPSAGPLSSPVRCAPTADAGAGLIVADTGNDGAEEVTLNGTNSFDPDGTIVDYRWTLRNRELGRGSTLTAELPSGFNTVRLTVTDNDGQMGIDDVTVSIGPVADSFVMNARTVLHDPDNERVISVTSSSVTIQLFAGEPGSFQPGDIYVGTGPNGAAFFLRVETVTRDGDTVTLTGQSVPAEEAFDDLEIEITDYPMPIDTEAAEAQGANVQSLTANLIDDDDLRIQASFDADFEPRIDYTANLRKRKFRLIASADYRSELRFDVEVKRPFTRSKEQELIRVPLRMACVVIPTDPPIPLDICANLSLALSVGFEASADAAGDVSLSTERYASTTVGLDCPNFNCNGVFEHTDIRFYNVDYDLPGVLDMRAYGKIALVGELRFFGKLGEADIALIPYVELDSELTTSEGFGIAPPPDSGVDPGDLFEDDCEMAGPLPPGYNRVDYELRVGFDGSVGARAPLFGIDEEYTFDIAKGLLARGCHVFETPSITIALSKLLNAALITNFSSGQQNSNDAKMPPILAALDANFAGNADETAQLVNNFMGVTEQQVNEGVISPQDANRLTTLADNVLTALTGGG